MTEFEKHEESIREAKGLPHCRIVGCMKVSDGAKVVQTARGNVVFCGTHYDAWLGSAERRRVIHLDLSRFGQGVMDFVNRVEAEIRAEVEQRAAARRTT